jgi:hypothetical protein
MPERSAAPSADSITRAAMMLLAMSMRPALDRDLLEEIAAAAADRGGRLDDPLFVTLDLHVVLEAIAAKAIDILGAALRERLAGTVDEIDCCFGDQVRVRLGLVGAQLRDRNYASDLPSGSTTTPRAVAH